MRYVAIGLVLAFWCGAVQAQDIGFAKCDHTQLNEKFLSVRVAFMVGDEEWSYRTLSGASLKSQTITFKKATEPVPLDGMKLDCKFTVEGQPRPSRVMLHKPWNAPITIKAGVAPKLAISVVEFSPGLWRASIGNAP